MNKFCSSIDSRVLWNEEGDIVSEFDKDIIPR